jgi:hypothetical protein
MFWSSFSASVALVAVSFLLSTRTMTFGFPTGAGGCGGNGSVGGPHLTASSIITGTLNAYGLRVQIFPEDTSLLKEDPRTFFSNGTDKNVLADRPYRIQLAATAQDNQFRGFLFRLSSTTKDTAGSLTIPDIVPTRQQPEIQVAQTCQALGIAGLTHTSNSLKSQVDVTLQLNNTVGQQPLVLEITAVIQNRVVNGTSVSQYYWDAYTIHVVSNASNLGTSSSGVASAASGTPAGTTTASAAAPAKLWLTMTVFATVMTGIKLLL